MCCFSIKLALSYVSLFAFQTNIIWLINSTLIHNICDIGFFSGTTTYETTKQSKSKNYTLTQVIMILTSLSSDSERGSNRVADGDIYGPTSISLRKARGWPCVANINSCLRHNSEKYLWIRWYYCWTLYTCNDIKHSCFASQLQHYNFHANCIRSAIHVFQNCQHSSKLWASITH